MTQVLAPSLTLLVGYIDNITFNFHIIDNKHNKNLMLWRNRIFSCDDWSLQKNYKVFTWSVICQKTIIYIILYYYCILLYYYLLYYLHYPTYYTILLSYTITTTILLYTTYYTIILLLHYYEILNYWQYSFCETFSNKQEILKTYYLLITFIFL